MHRSHRLVSTTLIISSALLGLSACAPGGGSSGDDSSSGSKASSVTLDQAEYNREDKERSASFRGDPGKPYEQYLPGAMVDAAKYKRSTPAKVCFSNASLSNVWRQTGWLTMYQQLQVLKKQGVISNVVMRDAQDNEDTQVADINYLVKEGGCDGYIIAPATVEATKGAIERACQTGKPVIVFDRGTTATCVTSFVHSVGGYAWGIDSASFLADKVKPGGHIVALRTAAGVDVFEQRWAAAQKIFGDAKLKVSDHLTGADPAKIKSAMADELAKGDVDGVWVDLGDQAVPAIEAFQDAGKDIPPLTGEDNMGYLRAWKKDGFPGFAPVYSCFQWRTALIALADLYQGRDIPKDWVLPQQPITQDQLDSVLKTNEAMPDVHSARFGGEDLPGFPAVFAKRKMP